MKRYLLFQGSDYYPAGGWFDFIGSHDTAADAFAQPKEEAEWRHVIDITTGLEVHPDGQALPVGVKDWLDLGQTPPSSIAVART